MNHRFTHVFLIIIFLSGLYANDCENSYKKSLEKWNKSGIKEYTARISYAAFTPYEGIWEIKAKNGKISSCTFNGKTENQNNKIADMLTIESLYKTAGEGLQLNKSDPFIIKIDYGINGFIKSLAKIRNPEYKNKVKTDSTFRIEILEFIPDGR